MDNQEKDPKKLGRRRALEILGIGLAAGGLVATGVGCGKKDTPADNGGGGGAGGGTATGGGADCSQDIDEGSKTLRRTLQYKPKAVVPEKHCSACAQFIPTKYPGCGGGCKLIPGPVKPEGGCLSFAPIGSDAAPPT
jgi:hypothetical protein